MQTSSLFEPINTFNPESLYRIITVHVSFACTKSKRPNMLNSLFPIVREFPGFARKSGPRLGSKKNRLKKDPRNEKRMRFSGFWQFSEKATVCGEPRRRAQFAPPKEELTGPQNRGFNPKGGCVGCVEDKGCSLVEMGGFLA